MLKYRVYKDGEELSVQAARVSRAPINRVWEGNQRSVEQTEEAYFVSFDMSDSACLRIEVCEEFDSYELRPRVRDYCDSREGNSVTLTVSEPMQFTFEQDGAHNALHIFVNPASKIPDGDIIYFGAGEHDAGLIWLESNQTLYIDDGAVVYGVVYAKDAENVRIMGRGVLDASPYRRGNDDHEGGREIINALLARGFTPVDMKYHGNLVLNHCKNCLVEGVILRDAPMWSLIIRNDSENITVDNVKIIGQWRYNSDGINVCTSSNVNLKNCFVRSFDDCIIMRGAYLDGECGAVDNVIVENCVLWCDWGKCLEAWCGHKPTEIRNIVFRNNYLIHLNNVAMNITVWYGSNHSLIKGVRYENIFIDVDDEYCFNQYETPDNPIFAEKLGFEPMAVNIRIERIGKMIDLGSQRCEPVTDYSEFNAYFGDVLFKNIRYVGTRRSLPIVIEKHSKINHTVENIQTIDCDFTIDGWC